MREGPEIYLCTVCLERNRWGSRRPSFRVSDWLARVAADGFDGLELWENHFLAADDVEQARLAADAAPLAVYNSYVGFDDGAAEARERAADAVTRLRAAAVKYNLGADTSKLAEYRRNLLAWADRLPGRCRPLCECHQGTVLERAEAAAAFFADLDPARFGVMVHVGRDADTGGAWFAALGSRVQHLHVQLRTPSDDPSVEENRPRLDASFAAIRAHGFAGSVAIEFTRGIGKDETIAGLYANALTDRAYCLKQLSGPGGGKEPRC